MRRVAVYAGTRNVYPMMMAAAKSLLAHTQMDRVWFLIEDDEFPEPLPNLIRTENAARYSIFDPNGPNYNSKWTWMTLMRLVVPVILAWEDLVLWLDVDTIVEQDIGDLFDIDMAENYVAMVAEPARSKFPFVYHNAGVMLMDLDRIREDELVKRWIRLIDRDPFTAPDQDVINLICQGEILTLGPEWNSAGAITQDARNPYIRHYAGYLRPLGLPVFEQYRKSEWRVKT